MTMSPVGQGFERPRGGCVKFLRMVIVSRFWCGLLLLWLVVGIGLRRLCIWISSCEGEDVAYVVGE